MSTNSAEPNETATFSVMSNAVEHAGTIPSNTGGQARRYLGVGCRFIRHLLEMVVAGMVVLMIYRRDRYEHGVRKEAQG
jgi:hypothetical protein